MGSAGAWAASDYGGVTSTANGVAATTDTFQITGLIVLPGIELPASDRAPYMVRPFDQELIPCKRYWQKTYDYGTAPGTASSIGDLIAAAVGSTNRAFLRREYPVEMRAAPTATIYSTSGTTGKMRLNTVSDIDAALYVGFTGQKSLVIYASGTQPALADQIEAHVVVSARL